MSLGISRSRVDLGQFTRGAGRASRLERGVGIGEEEIKEIGPNLREREREREEKAVREGGRQRLVV